MFISNEVVHFFPPSQQPQSDARPAHTSNAHACIVSTACSAVESAIAHGLLVLVLSFLVLLHLDHVVDSQDGDGSLCGKLKTLDLALPWLEHSCLAVVPHSAGVKVQPHPLELSLALVLDGCVVDRSQLRLCAMGD
jgi:hypothetical protein